MMHGRLHGVIIDRGQVLISGDSMDWTDRSHVHKIEQLYHHFHAHVL